MTTYTKRSVSLRVSAVVEKSLRISGMHLIMNGEADGEQRRNIMMRLDSFPDPRNINAHVRLEELRSHYYHYQYHYYYY